MGSYYKGLVGVPSLVPWTVLLLLNRDGALSNRDRKKWLETQEREGRGKCLDKALVLNTPHHGPTTSSPTFNYVLSSTGTLFAFT